jgi:hypothetical protein
MPAIMDANRGEVDRWLKTKGDTVEASDTICEATVGDFTVGIDSGHTGIIAEIVLAAGIEAEAGSTLVHIVDTEEAYLQYIENKAKVESAASKSSEDVSSIFDRADKDGDGKIDKEELQDLLHSISSSGGDGPQPDEIATADSTIAIAEILRVIRHLTEQGSIPEGSEFAKELKRLIRKADPDIIATFNASYEGDTFNEETFDGKFFVQESSDIIADRVTSQQDPGN